MDHDLISGIKAKYLRSRPLWRRLKELRGFSSIELTRFELMHSYEGVIPCPIDWQWPKFNDEKWASIYKEGDDLSADSLSKLMVQIWSYPCFPNHKDMAKNSREDTKNGQSKKSRKFLFPRVDITWPDNREVLPRVEDSIHRADSSWIQSSWLSMVSSIKIYRPKGERQQFSQGLQFSAGDNGLFWLQKGTIEIEFDPSHIDPKYILQRTPKKLNQPLSIDPEGKNPPIGWAIWIEEDFAIPWYLCLIFTIISLGIFVFAVWYTADHGPAANGWTIGSFLFIIVNLLLTIWVLKAKDSKHARSGGLKKDN